MIQTQHSTNEQNFMAMNEYFIKKRKKFIIFNSQPLSLRTPLLGFVFELAS